MCYPVLNDVVPNENNYISVPNSIFCDYCNKSFVCEYGLNRHLGTCKKKKLSDEEKKQNKGNEEQQMIYKNMNNLLAIMMLQQSNSAPTPSPTSSTNNATDDDNTDTVPTFSETLKSTAIKPNKNLILSNKIKEHFINEEQINFSNLFREYLRYDIHNDFVIELEDIWELLGYPSICDAKHALLNAKYLKENKDYKIRSDSKTIFLTFKKFCVITATDQSCKIYDYYNLLEKCLIETNEEAHKEEIYNLNIKLLDNISQKELTLLKSFHLKNVLYLIRITDKIIKFGFSSDLFRRLKEHKDKISRDIELIFCIETMYNVYLEKTLKINMKSETNLMKLVEDKLESRIIKKEFNGNVYTELIELDSDFTLSNLVDLIIELKETISKDEVIKILQTQAQNK
jgi:predicted GIY-YIG superfamily endonuclease